MVKIARWSHQGETRSGFIEGAFTYPLPEGMSTQDLLNAGLENTLRLAETKLAGVKGLPLADVTLLAPLHPASLRDFVAFEEHVEGIVKNMNGTAGVVEEWYQAPTFYFANPHTVHSTGATVDIPSGCEELDFEAEVAVVIGRVDGSDGIDLDEDAAKRHIFGYTVLNDWSARDLQRREMKVGLGPCKGKDFASTLGPWIVTADEFEGQHDREGFLPLALSVEVNGEAVGTDYLSNMGWPFEELVSYASQDSRIVPGDVLGSGTCGRGCLAELWGRNGKREPPPLKSGDAVRMWVQGIGAIENTVGKKREAKAPVRALPRPRNRPTSEPANQNRLDSQAGRAISV